MEHSRGRRALPRFCCLGPRGDRKRVGGAMRRLRRATSPWELESNYFPTASCPPAVISVSDVASLSDALRASLRDPLKRDVLTTSARSSTPTRYHGGDGWRPAFLPEKQIDLWAHLVLKRSLFIFIRQLAAAWEPGLRGAAPPAPPLLAIILFLTDGWRRGSRLCRDRYLNSAAVGRR